ncbi:MAG: hypothetical protein HY922_11005 [Elusimicrobia bacterium]|nr:hypothetical protein [Elusimicrobiota bacterium]
MGPGRAVIHLCAALILALGARLCLGAYVFDESGRPVPVDEKEKKKAEKPKPKLNIKKKPAGEAPAEGQ